MRHNPRPMPREASPSQHVEQVEYRGVTLGRIRGHFWAMWHATAGWIDTGETQLAAARGVVDYQHWLSTQPA